MNTPLSSNEGRDTIPLLEQITIDEAIVSLQNPQVITMLLHASLNNHEQCLKLWLGVCNTEGRCYLSVSLRWGKAFTVVNSQDLASKLNEIASPILKQILVFVVLIM
jgi:hypothetical protein